MASWYEARQVATHPFVLAVAVSAMLWALIGAAVLHWLA